MPEWRRLVRERLVGIDIPAADEISIVEELAQHVEDRYRDLCSGGTPDADALAASLGEITGDAFLRDLTEALNGADEREPGE